MKDDPGVPKVLLNGRYFEWRALPKDFRRGEPGDCFREAALLALRHEELTYNGVQLGSAAAHSNA